MFNRMGSPPTRGRRRVNDPPTPTKPEPTTLGRVTDWLRTQPYVVLSAGVLLGITIGYWSKRR